MATRRPGLILREKEPLNMESPPSALRERITRSDEFYVRNHFAEPDLARSKWRLKVEGAVRKPRTFSYRDLTAIGSQSRVAVMECAGNGRVFLAPKEEGVQWQSGAVGNARFTGVPLTKLLDRVGILSAAVDVVFEGADHGEIEDEPASPGDIHFARSVPVATARRGGVLLAYEMNGEPLTRSHGFPVRVVVPGWYGMASVKWLTRIVVTDRPFDGFFQSLQYSRWERMNGTPTLVPVTQLQVKSIIVEPAIGSVLPAGEPYIVRGQAWTGAGTVARVEVSVNGGRTWAQARMTSPASRHTWRSWAFDWRPAAGEYSLMARATDSQGRTQPMDRDTDRRSYEIHHVVPTPVVVRESGAGQAGSSPRRRRSSSRSA
jgi:DMSO/TMAO reductase YedYZ molybdopterin-dependent catalytic subunit